MLNNLKFEVRLIFTNLLFTNLITNSKTDGLSFYLQLVYHFTLSWYFFTDQKCHLVVLFMCKV